MRSVLLRLALKPALRCQTSFPPTPGSNPGQALLSPARGEGFSIPSPGGRGKGEREVDYRPKASISMQLTIILVFSALLIVLCAAPAHADPIKKVQGTITEVEEGFLWLKPDGEASPRKFVLRWKARFVPPRLPLKGDRVLILYKDKEEGAVIYGVDYLSDSGSADPGESRRPSNK